ncbi:hypothetical protein [Paenibacillus arenilitoris]|uniref:Uncharacterized protein n=1 Tax=Paenibacillus arenilitoris TaxID=2772299 RepID=A0A927CGD2_9BACL|nr:hypothetical protein [Paenibacillus arenilitoris]MBD2866979.1 hypothetical protein [Paenibacillus arenilitoris]
MRGTFMSNARVTSGEPMRQWLCAGPFETDVSRLYVTNYEVPLEPFLPIMREAERQARDCTPAEGHAVELFGQTSSWALKRCDPSEAKMTWARFGEYARFLTTCAYARVVADKAGTYRFRLWAAGSIVVFAGGKESFRHERLGRTEGEFRFEAELGQGANDLLVVLCNVHLHCTNSFMLIPESDGLATELPLLGNPAGRERIEADFAKFYLRQYVMSGEDRLTLETEGSLDASGTWRFSVYPSVKGVKLSAAPVWSACRRLVDGSPQELCGCAELSSLGEYSLYIDYEAEDGSRVEGVRLTFYRIDFIDCPKTASFAERKADLMRRYAGGEAFVPSAYGTVAKRNGVYRELIKLALGGKPDEKAIEETIAYIDGRYDCADFAMHGLIRLYARHRNGVVLPQQLLASMKRCILEFKYWEDEPGRSMMFTRSENHEILFFSAEYLAGLLFPEENFANSGQNGLFHIQKGKSMTERWIKEKGTYGYMEWHSNTYYEEDLLALLNLYDFAESNSYLRILAKQLIDLTVFIIATHSHKGVMGTTHGRCYEETVIHPELEAMSHLNWLLFGAPKRLRADRLSIGAAALIDSGYEPDPALEAIASDESERLTLTRMGLFPHEGLGGVNCSTYRTKDYMVSGLVESQAGRHGHQVQAGQVLLDGSLPVFVTCFDNKSESTRPSYWGGQYVMPKTIACRNVLAYVYRIDGPIGYTHCYFPFEQFDETRDAGKWLFGRKGRAYVAAYSLKPCERTISGKYKNRELICYDKRNIWIIEAGSEAQHGSFDAFVQAVANARLIEAGDEVDYASPLAGELRLSWERTCLRDGEPVLADNYPLIRNELAESEYGSGLSELRLGGKKRILNFKL